jgi:hypothetical protein
MSKTHAGQSRTADTVARKCDTDADATADSVGLQDTTPHRAEVFLASSCGLKSRTGAGGPLKP